MNTDSDETAALRTELREARAEIERLATRLALRERERELQRRFEEQRERKRHSAEEALKLRILYADLLFQSNPNTLFLFDEQLRFVLGSRHCLLGRMPDDLTGKPLREIFASLADAAWIDKIHRQSTLVVEEMQLWRYNDTLHLPGGRIVEAQVIISPVIQEDGVCRGVLLTINDVGELAEARWRAEEADRLKSVFLAQMSHEIRTPMNAIVGIAEILLHDKDLSEAQRKYVRDIQLSSSSLLTIINDILDFSKLDSGKLVLAPIHFDLRAMLDNLCSLVSYMASEKNLFFRMETAGDIPLCLYGDDVRIRQVLLNLLSNAVKFTFDGGVTLRVCAEGDRLVFSVTDTGLGIAAEDQAGLFEPFRQAANQGLRHVQGTGLGLSICRNLVDLMSGDISLKSERGKGSVFTVALPLTPGDMRKVTSRDLTEDEDVYAPDARVLVVDDNEVNLNVAFGLLRTLHGLRCDLATSGPEALAKAAATDYHLILMDHMMPDMDGVETTRRLRDMGGHNAVVPIVALTANAVSGAREMLLSSRMDDFLGKPVLKSELARVLRSWLPAGLCVPRPAQSAAASASDSSLGALSAVADLDVAGGLSNLGGDEANYLRSLRLLARKIPEADALMRDLLGQGDAAAFCVQVHGMKSSLASVGGAALSALAAHLETAAKANDLAVCHRDYPVFSARLVELGAHLGAALGVGEESGKSGVGSEADLAKWVGSLRSALDAYDYDRVSAALEEMVRLDFGRERNAAIAGIGQCVEAFDYDGALRGLAGLDGGGAGAR